MPVRNLVHHPHARGGPAARSGHIGFGAGLVDEHQLFDRHIFQVSVPEFACGFDVRPVLLRRMDGLFFKTSFIFFSHLLIA